MQVKCKVEKTKSPDWMRLTPVDKKTSPIGPVNVHTERLAEIVGQKRLSNGSLVPITIG